jgi:GT2 family glycosyltransferase
MNIDVSVIIVNYNTKILLYGCLVSIFKQTKGVFFEVIVSDNASTDGSVEMLAEYFPEVILIENEKNLGFGAANNRGLEIANGKYIFYLNSDTILLNNAIKMFCDFWENYPNKNRLGALGCNLVDENGYVSKSYGCFPTTATEIKNMSFLIVRSLVISILFFLGINYKSKPRSVTRKYGIVDFVSGAAFFLKNDEFAYFDRRYFLYYEETDLQFELKRNGRNQILIDGPEICHFYGKTDISSGIFKQLGGMSGIYASFSRINYLKKHKLSCIGILLIKLLTYILWINPLILSKTRFFLKKLFYY